MATKCSSPNRGSNCDIHFDLNAFHPRLQEALRYGPYTDLPKGISDSAYYGVNYLVSELSSKYADGTSSTQLRDVALQKWSVAESECRLTNTRFKENLHYLHQFSFGVSASSFIQRVCVKIGNLLEGFSWDEAERGFGWGPGATYRLGRTQKHPYYKYQGLLETTPGNLALAYACVMRSPLWRSSLDERFLELVPGNKITTVPKNAKTDRVIAIEPRMNMYVQKGIGKMIRTRLKRVGIDIDSQQENRDMALLGSRFENLATIDLSSASDMISYEIVGELLPPEWVEALEQCRSPVGFLPSGEQVHYQKFSSMGNGYTFELETLLFWALARTVIDFVGQKDRRCGIYGDDIIVPVDVVTPLMEVLSYFGFNVNAKKSHVSGPFRESCGGHFHSGDDVSPFYVRRPVNKLDQLFLLHNNLYRWCDRNRWNGLWDRKLMWDLLTWVRGHAPSNWRQPRIPDGMGDGAFIGTFDHCRPKRAPHGWEGFSASVLVDIELHREVDHPALLLHSLSTLESRERPKEPRHFSYKFLGRTDGPGTPLIEDCRIYQRDQVLSWLAGLPKQAEVPSSRSKSYPGRGRKVRIARIHVPQFAGLDIRV